MINRFRIAEIVFLSILILTMWLSSGSITPIATTHKSSYIIECGYLVNTDHEHWVAIFNFLDNKEYFAGSVVMRRILYPIFAFPFMKIWGYMEGGFIATVVLYIFTFLIFASFLSRKLGKKSAVVWMMLFSTYPGIHYWSGLPYAYVSIVPIILFSTMVLWKILYEESLGRILLCALLLGVFFTAYDLMPIFGLAFCLILLKRKKYLAVPLGILLFIVPLVVVVVWLQHNGISPMNRLTGVYVNILSAFTHNPNFKEWFLLLDRVPSISFEAFLYSGFLFLPLLFVIHFLLAFKYKKKIFSGVEIYIILAIAIVFLFNNCLPPYEGVQMRGEWMHRLYQPIFIVYMLVAARLVTEFDDMSLKLRRVFWTSCVIVFLFNTMIVTGPIMGFPYLSAYVYHKFYQQAERGVLVVSMKKYGRVPIGICRDRNSVIEYSESIK